MNWAEARLREDGRIPALAAWMPAADPETTDVQPQLRPAEAGAQACSIKEQEALLAAELAVPWQRGELAAAALVVPVLYGKSGSGERSQAVRLHIEDQEGYCADILMPYRIRAGWRWRGTARNRVHFSHPVAQESDRRFGDLPMRAGE